MVAQTPNIRPEVILRERSAELARLAVDRQYAQSPDLADHYGPHGRAKCVEDVTYHLKHLAEAVAADHPKLFLDYIAWVKTTLMTFGVEARHIEESLETLAQTLRESLPEESHKPALHVLHEARNALPQMPDAPPKVKRDTAPLGDLPDRYLADLLSGNRAAASTLITNAIDGGIDARDIYRHVFQQTQQEVGRLWQMNQITVAQEHFCTAATQFIMTQLYPHIFTTKRTGGSVVVTCVTGELHELGARMVSDWFEIHGWDSYYIGANTPTGSVPKVLRDRQPDLLAISATMTFHLPHVIDVISAVRNDKECAAMPIIVGGRVFSESPELTEYVGADGTAADGEQAVQRAVQLVGVRNQ